MGSQCAVDLCAAGKSPKENDDNNNGPLYDLSKIYITMTMMMIKYNKKNISWEMLIRNTYCLTTFDRIGDELMSSVQYTSCIAKTLTVQGTLI